MPRNPTTIKDLNDVQVFAYYKSFLQALDNNMAADLSDWEAGFVESCLQRVEPYTPKQAEIIARLMDKNPKVMPTYKHYDTEEHARAYIYE